MEKVITCASISLLLTKDTVEISIPALFFCGNISERLSHINFFKVADRLKSN